MSTDTDSFMDDRFDDPWASDIVESYFDLSSEKRSTPLSLPTDSSNGTNYTYNSKYAMKQRRSSSQQSASQMLSAPSLEKTDSQYSPMSSGLITPLDSIWTISPDRRRSGRFSGDSSGVFGQSNRWSLGTQLSNVSFTELPLQTSDEDSKEKMQEWTNVENHQSLSEEEEDDKIFHPDDEIIDPRDPVDASVKRTSIGSRARGQEWPSTNTVDLPQKTIPPSIEPRFRPASFSADPPKPDRQPLRISTCDPLETDPYPTRRASTYTTSASDITQSFKYPYDPTSLPKATNRRSFIESPPEILNSDLSWPLTSSTSTSYTSSIWTHEKSLPATPASQRTRGPSFSTSRRTLPATEEHPPSARGSLNLHDLRPRNERPQSWNPRCHYLPPEDFDINLDRAILGSTARLQTRQVHEDEEHQMNMAESIFNSLKLTESPKQRNSMPNGIRSYTWADEYQQQRTTSGGKESMMTEQQKQKQHMMRIISDKGLNPPQFDTAPKHARYFVIKSYNEDDVHKSLKFNIWASTEIGNRRLDKAYRESSRSGPIYLFFSVNASGQFCGMARMMSSVDYTNSSSVWTQTDKWKGRMDVRWIFVKDIPNSQLRHIRVYNNENKPVTNSRDTQELPPDAGMAMLRIFLEYPFKTSVIISNLVTAELKEEQRMEEMSRHNSLQSIDELGQYHHQHNHQRQSLQSDDYSRYSDVYSRHTSWQSIDDRPTANRLSYQQPVDVLQDYRSQQQSNLNRRNTIGGPISQQPRLVNSATPTSGTRGHDYYTAPSPARHPDSSNPSMYRSMLSGFASLGELYHSHRYPPFHGGTTTTSRYDDENRYF